MVALDVRDLVVCRGGRRVVDGVTFGARSGAVTAVLGPNGAGKTTTLECAAGLRTPDSGSVSVLGGPPGHAASRVGVMLQQGGIYPSARPLEWLRYLQGLYPETLDPCALLELVAIAPDSRTPARRMSGGEQQRVKLAAALLPDPELLMLDEPTAGLDPLGRRKLLDAISRKRDTGCAIVLTTHQLQDVDDLADWVVVIVAGRVVAEGTLPQLLGADRAMAFEAAPGVDTRSLGEKLPVGYRVEERLDGRYVVHGAPTPDVMASVAAWLAQSGIDVSGLSRGERTLEQLLIDEGQSD